MNIVYTYYTPTWKELADITRPKQQDYCNKHKFIRVSPPVDNNSVWAYKKMVGLEGLLNIPHNEIEIIWILDCDTLITNPAIPFTDFVDNEHDIFITKDVNGINAGSWIIRNTEASRKFVETIVNNFDAPHEQILMERYIDMVKVKYLPHPSINSYKYELYQDFGYGVKTHEEGQWEPGDLLLHLPGLSLEKRIEIFKGMI